MAKYASFHFSPLNNRSMLMPRIPKGTKPVPGFRPPAAVETVPIDPATARQLAANAPSLRRLLVHPQTGEVLLDRNEEVDEDVADVIEQL